MSLDIFYSRIKSHSLYPINDREQLIKALGNVRVKFEHNVYDGRDIGLMINEFPIKTPSHLMELFIKYAEEEYSDEESKELGDFEAGFA